MISYVSNEVERATSPTLVGQRIRRMIPWVRCLTLPKGECIKLIVPFQCLPIVYWTDFFLRPLC